MSYTSFAIIGAGADIGIPIAKELLAYNASVVLITRPGSSKELPTGVKSASVHYTDKAALIAVLREHKVQVVLSTISAVALDLQFMFGDAAKEAGASLFLPSEYGFAFAHRTEGVLGIKTKIQQHLKSIGLPYALVYTGFFIEQFPWISGLDETGEFIILGKGDSPVSFTSIPDFVGFTAYVLTHLPPAQLDNATFRLEGAQATVKEFAALYGPNTPVVYKDAIPSEYPEHEIRTWILKFVDGGTGTTGYNAELERDEGTAGSSNKLWEGHHWKGIEEALNL